jgi:hypothetical protein
LSLVSPFSPLNTPRKHVSGLWSLSKLGTDSSRGCRWMNCCTARTVDCLW